MKPIVTLTLNPAIDSAAEAEHVRPIRKVRTWNERYDPGGGGINAARIIAELGGNAVAVYLSGGASGPLLDDLVRSVGIESVQIPIRGNTRVSHTVHERSSGLEFRFVPDGPAVEPPEWGACLRAVQDCDCDYLLASGSLPRNVPTDFYVKVAEIAARKGARLVLDTSGAALRSATQHGVFLMKPSLGELEQLVGRTLSDTAEQELELAKLIERGAAEIIALTLGQHGAVLATEGKIRRLAGRRVTPRSAVGAGDSFLGAMTLGLAQGRSVEDAFILGMAAGTAAVLTSGTALCRRADVERIYQDILHDRTSR